MKEETVLSVKDLCVWYPVRSGILARTTSYVRAVDGISFSLHKGEILGIVGESGCGKTTTARAILGLEPVKSGEITVYGEKRECGDSVAGRLDFARKVQVVFQDPFASLNPRHTVTELITEGMIAHGLASSADRRSHAERLLKAVGLPPEAADRYPHAFSGGQRQRIAIARALSLNPGILICDEAVSALDLSVRAQILNLLMDLRDEYGLSYLFITHDIGVVRHIADSVAVMKAGKIVESGGTEEVFASPSHPYTKQLLAAVP